MVTLTHPNLPGQPIEVDRRSMAHYVRSGWQEQAAPAPEPKAPKKRRAKASEDGHGESADTE